MNKTIIAVMLAALAWSCDGIEQNSVVTCEKTFQGEHPLMCVEFDSAECAYTHFYGGAVEFMWQTFDGSYAMSEVPVDKFRVKIDEYADQPYVKFRWTRCRSASDLKSAIQNNVSYVLMVCDREDCPPHMRPDDGQE